jgi:hypothetical protein
LILAAACSNNWGGFNILNQGIPEGDAHKFLNLSNNLICLPIKIIALAHVPAWEISTQHDTGSCGSATDNVKWICSTLFNDSLSPLQPAFLDSAADQSTGPFSSPTKVTTLPCLCPQGTHACIRRETCVEKAAAAATLLYHHILPVMSQPFWPLYLHALAERAAAAALTTPTSLTPALVTPAWPPSQRTSKYNKNTTSIMKALAEETGHHIQWFTVFGEQCEKVVEEQKAKVAEAVARKADWEKAVHVKVNEERVKSINGARSKKTVMQGNKWCNVHLKHWIDIMCTSILVSSLCWLDNWFICCLTKENLFLTNTINLWNNLVQT